MAFELERLETGYISNQPGKNAERRLYDAHIEIARRGHETFLPVRLRDTLSAPVIPPEGQAFVATMEVDTTAMLAVLPYSPQMSMFSVRTVDCDGDTMLRRYGTVPGFGLVVASSELAAGFEDKTEYLRKLVLGWAQKQFETGCAGLAAMGAISVATQSRLAQVIRIGIDEAFERFLLVAGGGAYLVEKTAAPRLVLRDDATPFPNLKLADTGYRPGSDWKTDLASFPAGSCVSASRIRHAAVAFTHGGRLEDAGADAFDDFVTLDGNTMIRTDMEDFDTARAGELGIFAEALASMARDFGLFCQERLGEMEVPYALSIAGGDLAAFGVHTGETDGGLEDLHQALAAFSVEADGSEAYNRFLDQSGWNLPVSPFALAEARINHFAGRDPAHGLATQPEVNPKVPGEMR